MKFKCKLHCFNCDSVRIVWVFEIKKIQCPHCKSKNGVITEAKREKE